MAQRETQVKRRAQKRKKAQTKRAGLKAAAKRKGVLLDFEKSLALQDAKIRALGRTVGTLYNNEVELGNSTDRLEEEFCVLARLLIPKVNDILIALGSEDPITEEEINSVFLTWNEFKQRPDFKAHFVPWFLGVALEDLPPPPPPPPPPEVKEEKPADTPAPKGEGAEEFVGDYGQGETDDLGDETTEEGKPPVDEGSAKDALPEGQDPDGPVPGEEQGGSAEMPEVPDGV